MNIENQTITGNNEVTVNDSLNAALLELTIKPKADTINNGNNELLIYVDKSSKTNPSDERKQYQFELKDILRFYNNTSDIFKQKLEVNNNDIILKTIVERNITYNDETQETSIQNTIIEELESIPITLFEGENYIYTNYENIDIELIYPKNNQINKIFLNGSIYHNHKQKNDGEFTLDDIYFKDAFTKTEDNINLEINNASIDTLISNNNKFSLDKEGNLTVNTVTCNNSLNASFNEEELYNLVYPIGSTYITETNINPTTIFGGQWELYDKEFKPQTFNGDTLFTRNTTNTESHSCYATRSGHTILLEVQYYTKGNTNDDTKTIGNFNLNTLGITRFNNALDVTGYTDGGNCAVFIALSTTGTLSTVDVIPDSYVSSGKYIECYLTTVITPEYMKDEACNKFYWRKTA